MSLPGLVRDVPIKMPRVFRVPLQVALVQDDVVASFLQRIVVAVVDQMGVTVHDAQDLDAVAGETRPPRSRSPRWPPVRDRRQTRSPRARLAAQAMSDITLCQSKTPWKAPFQFQSF